MRILIVILLTWPMTMFGQSIGKAEIIEDYCKRAELLDWNNKSVTDISGELSQIAVDIQKDHLETISHLKETLRTENPEFSNSEVDKEFSKQLIESLVDTCDSYIKLSRGLMRPCPQENETLTLIVVDVDSVLIKHQNLPYAEQYDLANKQIFQTIISNKSSVNKDYLDGFIDPNLADESGLYLLHHSKLYYKAFAITEAMKLFK
jgi:hypothetical protein